MRYRGIMFRSSDPEDKDSMLFCIPFVDGSGGLQITPPRSVGGWDMDVTSNELLVGEFVLFDGTMSISLEDYVGRMGESADDECNLFIRAVKVASQDCGESVHKMFLEDREQFAYACHHKIAQAKQHGLFDQRRILPQWKKAGYSKEAIGEVADIVS